MSAERVVFPRGRRRRALLGLLLATACTLSGPEDQVGESAPRLMDELCANGAYTLEGAAVRTTGITNDSCGFVVGPGAGSVTFGLAVPSTFDSYEVSALVTEHDVTKWVTLVNRETGSVSGPTGAGSFILEGDGREMEVSDLRLRGVTDAGCSIARRPRRRRFSF